MNIFGIGTWEILIILVIILLILGPEDLQKTGRTIGRWINKVTRSEGWSAITAISREVRGLPSRLAREAQLDDLKDQIDLDKQIGSTPLFKVPEKKTDSEAESKEPSSTENAAKETPESPASNPENKEQAE
jgi:sec-independent protein translocase protein TatB